MHTHHVHAAMVVASMTLALSTALFGSITTPSSAAPRHALTLRVADSPLDEVLLPNQADILIEQFTLRAGREAVLVDTLSFENCVTGLVRDYDGDCADTGETAGNDSAISTIALLYNDGTQDQVVDGTLVDGRVTFTGLTLPLPVNRDVPVSVRISTNTIDDVTVTSGTQFQINLNAITAPFHGVTVPAHDEIYETDMNKNITGSTHTLRQTLTALALSSTTPTGQIDDDWSEAFRVDISASSTGDATLTAMTLAVHITNNGGGNWATCPFLGASEEHFSLIDVTTTAVMPGTWEIYDEDGTACTSSEDAVGYVHITFDTPVTVRANETVTYALSLDATYANTTHHDLLQVRIPTEDELADLPTPLHAITWSDGTATGTNLDGSDIADLPVDGNILVF